MRRPGIGRSVLRGLEIIAERTEGQIASGFIPVTWKGAKLGDVKRACRYARLMTLWERERRFAKVQQDAEEAT